MCRIYRLLVRGLLVVIVCAFSFALLLAERPEMLLGGTMLEQSASHGQAINPDLAEASSILDLRGDVPRSLPLPERTVALTFDDGPDPTWTPAIQSVLDEQGVPGTFFVIGQEVLEHPSVVQSLHDAGHEIGNHTFTHPRVGALSPWQVRLQYQLTQEAVAGVIGQDPTVFRPPYSGMAPFLPATELEAASTASKDLGIISLLSDRIPKDFDESMSVDELVAQAMPPAGAGAVVVFHDGGGDRSRTVEALDRTITELKANGYRFVTASEFIGLRSAPSATGQDTSRLVQLTHMAPQIVRLLAIASVAFALYGVVRLVLLMVLSIKHRRAEGRDLGPRDRVQFDEPVSVIVPAYNEEVGIAAAVRSIVDSDYGNVEVIVVDDGSTDRTAQIVEAMGLSNVRVVRQANSGKPAALNTGVTAATSDVLVMVDGDTLFERDTVRLLVQPFLDPMVGAVAGNAKVGNRSRWWTRLQHLEYTLASSLERRAYAALASTGCVPGAVGAFRRSTLIEVGGVSSDTLAEDSDLTMAIARAGWTVAFAPAARAWTEAPTTLRGLYRQRYRWSYGVLQALVKHRRAPLERGAGGRLGRRVYPQQLLGYVGALVGPIFDLVFVLELLLRQEAASSTVVAWFSLNAVFVMATALALRLEGERMRSAVLAPMQQLLYRQILYLAVIRSIGAAIGGIRLPWNKIRRTGNVVVPVGLASPVRPVIDLAAFEPIRAAHDVVDLRDLVTTNGGGA